MHSSLTQMLLAYLLRERGGSKLHQESPSFLAWKPRESELKVQELPARDDAGIIYDHMTHFSQNPVHRRLSVLSQLR